MRKRALLATTLGVFLLLGISLPSTASSPQHLKLLALVNDNGTAAILSTPSSQGGGGGDGDGGETEDGGQIFPFVGYQVSEACTSSLRSSRCRTLYREDLPDSTMVLAAPLQGAVGLKQLRASSTDLTEEAEKVILIPNRNCIPLDVISYRDERSGDHSLLVLCLRQEMTQQVLVACKILINRQNISQSTLVKTCQGVKNYPLRETFSYDSISNFAFFPEGMQLLFTIDNGLEGFRLDRLFVMSYNIRPGSDCDRLQYIGDHMLNVYCRSGELLQYDINIESRSIANTNGVNFTCSPSLMLNLQQTTDNGTVVKYRGIASNFSGNNLTFAQCYGEGSFLIVDSLEGIKVLNTSTRSVREIANSSDFSQVVILEAPRMIVGLRVEASSPEVVVYDSNIEAVLQWPGSALAIGVVMLELVATPQPSTPVMPSTTTISSLMEDSSTYITSEPSLTSILSTSFVTSPPTLSSSYMTPSPTSASSFTLTSPPISHTSMTPPTYSASPSVVMVMSSPAAPSPSSSRVAIAVSVSAVVVGITMMIALILTIALLYNIYVRKRCRQREGNGDPQGINYMQRLDEESLPSSNCSTDQGSRKELLLDSSKSDVMETNPNEGDAGKKESPSTSSSSHKVYTPISTPTLGAKSATPSPSLAVANPNVTSPSPVLSSTPEEASSSTDSIPKLLLAEDQLGPSRQDSGSCAGTTCTPQAAEGSGCGSSLVAGRNQPISPRDFTPEVVMENSQQRTETEDLRNDLQHKTQLFRQQQQH